MRSSSRLYPASSTRSACPCTPLLVTGSSHPTLHGPSLLSTPSSSVQVRPHLQSVPVARSTRQWASPHSAVFRSNTCRAVDPSLIFHYTNTAGRITHSRGAAVPLHVTEAGSRLVDANDL